MTSTGVTSASLRLTLYVFCHNFPKPCRGPTALRPSTLMLVAPSATPATLSVSAYLAQKAASRGSCFCFLSSLASSWGVCSVIVGLLPWVLLRRVSCRVRGPHGFFLRIVDGDGVVQARDLEDAPVVVAEAVGKELLLLAVDTD